MDGSRARPSKWPNAEPACRVQIDRRARARPLMGAPDVYLEHHTEEESLVVASVP